MSIYVCGLKGEKKVFLKFRVSYLRYFLLKHFAWLYVIVQYVYHHSLSVGIVVHVCGIYEFVLTVAVVVVDAVSTQVVLLLLTFTSLSEES